MAEEKTFVVGDIHGCLHMLQRLMDTIPWNPHYDRLIFIGDYIDRGDDPKGVVDYLLAMKRYAPSMQFLIGNHEVLFLDYLKGRNQEAYFMNGGWETIKSYQGANPTTELDIPPEHRAFYESLDTCIELDDYYIVHAGFRPGVAVTEQSLQDMVWIRDRFISSDFDFGKRVIFGHTPFDEPLVMANKIGIDTGAVMGHRLTCLELPEMQFYSVEA